MHFFRQAAPDPLCLPAWTHWLKLRPTPKLHQLRQWRDIWLEAQGGGIAEAARYKKALDVLWSQVAVDCP